jgi:Arc/MetJ-type ribon-helix-helix transcriptional regulator
MDKRRVQLDFSEQLMTEIDRLQSKGGFATRAELIRHALRFLQWTMTELNDGNATLIIERDGTQREVLFPFWVGCPEAATLSSEEHSDSAK